MTQQFSVWLSEHMGSKLVWYLLSTWWRNESDKTGILWGNFPFLCKFYMQKHFQNRNVWYIHRTAKYLHLCTRLSCISAYSKFIFMKFIPRSELKLWAQRKICMWGQHVLDQMYVFCSAPQSAPECFIWHKTICCPPALSGHTVVLLVFGFSAHDALHL